MSNPINPFEALLAATGLFLVLTVLFYPQHGLFFRWRIKREKYQRILIEDALKHAFDCESKKINCTAKSLAGSLLISLEDATALIGRLSVLGLFTFTESKIELTPDGRSYALRIIRIHRLWERYLADQTSVPEEEWHAVAEEQEHRLTEQQVSQLAARIGNPQYDPHGDPIPTVSGEIPPVKGHSLLSLSSGEYATITHIEDEPEAVYAQLIAQGLYIGLQVMMIEHSKERVRIAANGEEIVLARIFADNITVAPIKEEEKISVPQQTLLSLKPGEEGLVAGISKACRGQQRRRLLDLGVVPGTVIRKEYSSAGGDPVAYKIRGALIALRNQHANYIFINKN